jgi:RNA polymerase sigma-70 factor (ECF subfamily)
MTSTSSGLLERLCVVTDNESWGRFVDIYGPLIYRWLGRYGLQDHDARDVAQEVLIAVFRALPTFHYDRGRGCFRSWLRQIVGHRLSAFWRGRRKLLVHADAAELERRLAALSDATSEESRQWDEACQSEVTTRVLRIIQTEFEPATWQAFWRVVVSGEKPAHVATTLGVSVNSVYLAKSRVLSRLRSEASGLIED